MSRNVVKRFQYKFHLYNRLIHMITKTFFNVNILAPLKIAYVVQWFKDCVYFTAKGKGGIMTLILMINVLLKNFPNVLVYLNTDLFSLMM